MSLRALFPLCLLLSVPSLPAQTGQQQQIDDLKAEVKALRTEVDQLKQTLQDLTAARTPIVDITGAPIMGDASAKLVVVEFSDFQCPYCREYFINTFHSVIDNYVKTGMVRYVIRDFPGESIHPQAFKAAEAGLCANEQGKFWEMHDLLFNNQRTLGTTGITDSAAAAGLDDAKFQACLGSGKYTAEIRKEEDETLKLGVKGTPAFFIGTPDPANPTKIKLSRALVGAQPLAVFQQTLDSLVSK